MNESTRPLADVCVIVPTFNRSKYLREAIEGILAQTRPPAEVIVVDDGSTDETPQVAAEFGSRISYKRKPNGGKPSAVNFALSIARSSFVIIADDDDVMCSSALEFLLAPLEQDEGVHFANGGLLFFRDKPGGGREVVSRPPFTVAETGHHFEALLLGYSLSLSATLIRKDCWMEMHGLNEAFRRSEDYEFMLRLTRRFRGVSVPERVIAVRRHEGDRGDATIRHSERERQLVHFDCDVRAFEIVRRDTPLGAYIGIASDVMKDEEIVQASFMRAVTMARHGVWHGFRQDVRECGQQSRELRVPLSGESLSRLTAIFGRADVIEAGLRETGYPLWVVKACIAEFGGGAVRPIARGFYYAARDAYSDGHPLLAIRCLVFAIQTFLLGCKRYGKYISRSSS